MDMNVLDGKRPGFIWKRKCLEARVIKTWNAFGTTNDLASRYSKNFNGVSRLKCSAKVNKW